MLRSSRFKQFRHQDRQRFRPRDEYAIILDFLPNGYPFDPRPLHKKTAIAQAVGKRSFMLLELIPKKDVFLQPQEEVYIGEGLRDKIYKVSGKLRVDKLTHTAREELSHAIIKIVKTREKEFVDFFNKAEPLTTRMHSLELIPGIGKRYMWDIIKAREEKPFESLEDIKQRIKLSSDLQSLITQRIMNELQGNEKHYLFVKR